MSAGVRTAIAGNLVIGDGSGSDSVIVDSSNQIANTSDVTINSSGRLQLSTSVSETIDALTINGGTADIGDGTLTAGATTMTGGAISSTSSGSFVLNGNVTTTASATTATISADVVSTAHTTFTGADDHGGGVSTLSGELSNAGSPKRRRDERLSGCEHVISAHDCERRCARAAKTGAVSASRVSAINAGGTGACGDNHGSLCRVNERRDLDLNGFHDPSISHHATWDRDPRRHFDRWRDIFATPSSSAPSQSTATSSRGGTRTVLTVDSTVAYDASSTR